VLAAAFLYQQQQNWCGGGETFSGDYYYIYFLIGTTMEKSSHPYSSCTSETPHTDCGGPAISNVKQHYSVQKRTGGTKRSLSVSFPPDETVMAQIVAEIESCMNYTDQDRKNMWYVRSDYHFARSTARVIAMESERYGHSKHLDGVYCSNTFQQQAQDALNMWVLHGHCRRGLERWANTHHGLIRKEDQRIYIQGILRAQQEMKLKDGRDGDKQAQAERLREVGFMLSRKASVFAQMMGDADAQAVKLELATIFGNSDGAMSEVVFQQAMSTAYGGHPLGVGAAGERNDLSRRMPLQRRNLGLGGPTPQRRINRLADLPSRAVPHGLSRAGGTMGPALRNGVGDPKITIKPKAAGRVPRIA
jgi:hypothetical protein